MCAAEELDYLECKAVDENPRACVPENVVFTEVFLMTFISLPSNLSLERTGRKRNPLWSKGCFVAEGFIFVAQQCTHAALDKLSRQCAAEFDDLVDCLDELGQHPELSRCRHLLPAPCDRMATTDVLR